MMIHQKNIETTYSDICDIIEYVKIEKSNKTKSFSEQVVYKNIKCRLSFSSIASANQTDTAASITQTVKLFINPDINIKAGSKIVVRRNGRQLLYKASGVPAVYSSHQEIELVLFDRWA